MFNNSEKATVTLIKVATAYKLSKRERLVSAKLLMALECMAGQGDSQRGYSLATVGMRSLELSSHD